MSACYDRFRSVGLGVTHIIHILEIRSIFMDEQKVTHTYGIWIPGEGWLRGKDVFADTSLDKSMQVARLIGRGTVVRFIDKSIVDLEQMYLDNEKRTLWQKIKTMINHLLSNNSKKTIHN